jgi:NitT/TauT family transport system substrate-binding protein
MMKKKAFSVLYICALIFGLMSGCTPAASTSQTAQPVTLKIALLPVLDALPMYVAQSQGLFTSKGIRVEFIAVASAPERDQLIASGQADGMINELIGAILNDKDTAQVQVVRYARAATSDSPLFTILAPADSGITSAEQLKGIPVAISSGTIIEYLNDRLLQSEGLNPDEIKSVAVPKIPDRIALLMSGKVGAAMLPDPATTAALNQGAIKVLDDSIHPGYSFSTITFRKATLDQHPEAVKAFLSAIEAATAKINADPQQWSQTLVDQKVMAPELSKTFKVPQFVTAGVPTQAQFADMVAWCKQKGLITADVPYDRAVNASFLPK